MAQSDSRFKYERKASRQDADFKYLSHLLLCPTGIHDIVDSIYRDPTMPILFGKCLSRLFFSLPRFSGSYSISYGDWERNDTLAYMYSLSYLKLSVLRRFGIGSGF
jgi:hypothetical protein